MKRLYSIIITMILVLSVFTGCSKTNISATNTTKASIPTEISTTEETTIVTQSPSQSPTESISTTSKAVSVPNDFFLEEKYWQKGVPIYKDNQIIGIKYLVDKGTNIFSPVSSVFSITTATKSEIEYKVVTVGHQILAKNQQDTLYRIYFVGDINTNIKYDPNKLDNKIEKGDILGVTSNDRETEITFTIQKINSDQDGNISTTTDNKAMEKIFENNN